MIVKRTKIGNSFGFIIPKTEWDRFGDSEDLEMRVEPGKITVQPKKGVRVGWSAQIALISEEYNDEAEFEGWESMPVGYIDDKGAETI